MESNAPPPNSEFDRFAGDYDQLLKKSITASGYDAAYFDEHKIKTVYRDYIVSNEGADTKIKIMNFGCGTGKSEQYINTYFPDCSVCSVDVSERSITVAKERNEKYNNVKFIHFTNVQELENLTQTFDVIFAANVFHHIPEELHVITLKTLKKLLSPGGYLYVFEHNPKNPLTRKVFETCEFDVGCKMIKPQLFSQLCKDAGFNEIEKNYVLFFPKVLAVLTGLEKYLKWCSWGAQYYIRAK